MAPLYLRTDEVHGRGVNLFIIAILFAFIAACAVISRLLSRRAIGKGLGPDDVVITLSMVWDHHHFHLSTLRAPC